LSNLAKYGTYDLESAEKEMEDSEKSGGSTSYMKLKEGKNVVRILPPFPGGKSPFRVIWEHYVNKPGGESVRFVCPRMEAKQPCAACAKADKLKATGNSADFTMAKEFFAKRRVYTNVIDRSEPEAGPKILAFGKMIHEALIKLRKNPDWGGDFCHPVKGFDVVIERSGTTKNDTEYEVTPKKTSPLGDESWLDGMHDLEKQATVLTMEEIRAKFAGKDDKAAAAKPEREEREVRALEAKKRSEPRKPAGPSIEDEVDDATSGESDEDDVDGDVPF